MAISFQQWTCSNLNPRALEREASCRVTMIRGRHVESKHRTPGCHHLERVNLRPVEWSVRDSAKFSTVQAQF